jgi:hypothetical protein
MNTANIKTTFFITRPSFLLRSPAFLRKQEGEHYLGFAIMTILLLDIFTRPQENRINYYTCFFSSFPVQKAEKYAETLQI